jgi:SAM-dependent methyltransferase
MAENDRDIWEKTWSKQRLNIGVDLVTRVIFREIARNIPIRSKRIIELGCGAGRLSNMFLEAGAKEVHLVDFSEEALKRASELLARFSNKRLIKQNLFHLDIDDKYELVISSGVVEHFTDEDLTRIVEIHKKLSQRYVIIIVPSYTIFNRIRSKTESNINQYGQQFPLDPSAMRYLCEYAGLKIVKNHRLMFMYGFPLPVIKGMSLLRNLMTTLTRPLDRVLGGLTMTICEV